MMNVLSTDLEGLLLLKPRLFEDHRGSFVKTYHEGLFRECGIAFAPKEEFFSVSRKDVVRGMHFQLPPMAHDKLVYCVTGSVLDVVVDLRKSSKTFGKAYSRELSAKNREMFFIPIGFAHGFLALEEESTMVYQTSTVHSPTHDAGILWSSIAFEWPVKQPVISERDLKFPSLREFASPF